MPVASCTSPMLLPAHHTKAHESIFPFESVHNIDFDKNPKSFGMTLHDVDGDAHKVFGSVMKRVGVHVKPPEGSSVTSMNETLTRYTIAGKNGHGIAEFLSRAK